MISMQKLCVPDVIKKINITVFNLMPKTNETRHVKWHKTLKVNVDQMQAFVIVNNIGIKVNADVNVKNRLTKEYVTKDVF